MKNRIIISIVLAALITGAALAQNPNMERLNAYKIAFFTKKLNLTEKEAEKFWPVYNEYQDSRNKLQVERQQIMRNFNQNELNMSEKEMTEAADKLISLEVREASFTQEFHNKIKTVLSPVKVMRLYQAENQYRIQLLNQLQERRQTRGNANGRKP
ncbi:MAG: hypothetical protein Q8868_06660 [Bacteroidota bacterium]|nr:hypothetical protein [Bacteroidota bacterium]